MPIHVNLHPEVSARLVEAVDETLADVPRFQRPVHGDTVAHAVRIANLLFEQPGPYVRPIQTGFGYMGTPSEYERALSQRLYGHENGLQASRPWLERARAVGHFFNRRVVSVDSDFCTVERESRAYLQHNGHSVMAEVHSVYYQGDLTVGAHRYRLDERQPVVTFQAGLTVSIGAKDSGFRMALMPGQLKLRVFDEGGYNPEAIAGWMPHMSADDGPVQVALAVAKAVASK